MKKCVVMKRMVKAHPKKRHSTPTNVVIKAVEEVMVIKDNEAEHLNSMVTADFVVYMAIRNPNVERNNRTIKASTKAITIIKETPTKVTLEDGKTTVATIKATSTKIIKQTTPSKIHMAITHSPQLK